jgi:hypothetical protein
MPKIDTFASRSRLKVRKEPYWSPTDTEQLYVGFRRGPDSWIARLQSDSNKSYRSLGKLPDFRTAIRAAKDWHQTCVAGVTNARATVADATRTHFDRGAHQDPFLTSFPKSLNSCSGCC